MSDRQTVQSAGREIAYATEGAGPALVLVTDRGADLGSLAALAHSVSSADFQVVRIEADEVQHVVDVLDALELAQAWVGGHGAGGVVARAVATSHHARVNGVLLLGVEAGAAVPVLADGIPVLVVQSSDDDVTPPANGDALRDAAPGLVSVVMVEGGGHHFPATRAGESAWAIEDYLDWD